MKHLRISKTEQDPLLLFLDCMKSTESLPFALSLSSNGAIEEMWIHFCGCREWIEELLSSPVTHLTWWAHCSPLASLSPSLSHLTDSSPVLLPPAVISCQLTGKRPIYKFNTRSWHLSCSCQLRQTCRKSSEEMLRHRFSWGLIETFIQIQACLHFSE